MSYRKITVDGAEHQYVVGRTHVKIRGLGAWPKKDVGHIEMREDTCECCGEPMSAIYGGDWTYPVLMVTPKDVANHIRNMSLG